MNSLKIEEELEDELEEAELEVQANELEKTAKALDFNELENVGDELRTAIGSLAQSIGLQQSCKVEIKTGRKGQILGYSKQFVDLGLTRVHAKTKYPQQLRWCRILSTCARGYLLTKFEPVEEVQCTFDSYTEQFSFSTNKPAHTKYLEKSEWVKVILGSGSISFKGNKRFSERFEAHRQLLRNTVLGDKFARGDTSSSAFSFSTVSTIEGCSGKEGKRDRGDVTDKESKLRTTMPPDWWKNLTYLSGEGAMHTESRLLTKLRDDLRLAKEPLPKRTVWVAGVMRPCLCCFVRLKRLKEELQLLNVDLIHKPRPGPLWPSVIALNGLTDEDRKVLLTYIARLYESEDKLYLTAGGGVYQVDSDSEFSDDEGKIKKTKGVNAKEFLSKQEAPEDYD